jgi:hypothetical protein
MFSRSLFLPIQPPLDVSTTRPVDPFDVYHVFRPAAIFVATVPFNQYRWDAFPQRLQVDAEALISVGNRSAALVFLRNTNNTWLKHSEGVPLTSFNADFMVRNAMRNLRMSILTRCCFLKIMDMEDGAYTLEWYDTIAATVYTTQTVQVVDGTLPIKTPSSVLKDTMLRAVRVSDFELAAWGRLPQLK